jgi:hypothetical protein
MIDVNEKVLISLMFLFELTVSLATIIIILFRLNSSDDFNSYKYF